MINGFYLEKVVNRLKKQEEQMINENKLGLQRHKTQIQLIEKYKNRVKDFIHEMNETPQKINKFVVAPSEIVRKYDSNNKGFIIKGWKSEKDRIEETVEKNKYLMLNPSLMHPKDFYKILRKRIPSKEIQPDMRFTDKTGLERVINILSSEIEHNPEQSKELSKYFKSLQVGSSDSRRNAEIMKTILRKMDKKTHFKAAESVIIQGSPVLNQEIILFMSQKYNRRLSDSTNLENHHGVKVFKKEKEIKYFDIDDELNKISFNPLRKRDRKCLSQEHINYLNSFRAYKEDPTYNEEDDMNNEPTTLKSSLWKEYQISDDPNHPENIKKRKEALEKSSLQARDALEKCDYKISPRTLKHPPLKIGSGHLVSGFGLSNEELNKEIQSIVDSRSKSKIGRNKSLLGSAHK